MSKSAFSDSVGNQIYQCIYQGPSQVVAVGGSSTQSTAFDQDCDIIRIAVDVDCFVEIGVNPTATTSSMYMPLGTVEYFGVDGPWKVAVLQKTEAGNCYITEGG